MAHIPATVTTFHSKEAKTQTIKKFRVFVSGFRKQRYDAVPTTEEEPAEKYVHVPTEAAACFLKTATPLHMKRANEVL
ncbi:hypothetical protein PFICI_06972 [Pestalotiopsis fici W106-1]|uniref:Uncharacterized protein n=1 Tax=Pestalotiopsis fici (strain W106-1 / CGMCC3.15140) TaxID=1229662 RepID=W3X7D1_PESFW|nr:uncharacterized protein PFICI_06972 [Pestalotiopsis fici W106-1]ETS81970.1 hypothetical protein PFICI_06972 [Pestalotiopsis fici W106-1]